MIIQIQFYAGLYIFIVFMCLPLSSLAQVHVVHAGESIADTIRQARPGEVVEVKHGYYETHLVIDKPLILKGINRPTLSGGNTGDVIRIKSPDVVIEGFIVRDSGGDLTGQNAGIYVEPHSDRVIIRNNDLTYNLFGIWFEEVKEVQAVNNLITGKRDFLSSKRGNGIQLYNTTGARVTGNNISFVRDAIYVDVSHHAVFRDNKLHHVRYGTHYMNSYYNLWENNETYLNRGGLALMEVKNQIVRNNIAWGNTDHGIMLRTIQDSVIEGNVVFNNGKGFFMYDAVYNQVRRNLVINNTIGIHLWAGSYNNEVEANDFINNHHQIRYVATRDERWGKKQGNFWSNYSGWDQNADGVGDFPYEANNIIDYITWRHPSAKLLLNSPAVHSLRMVSQQFPILRPPSIIDHKPKMTPFHQDWSKWIDYGHY